MIRISFKLKLLILFISCSFKAILSQRCKSNNICYGYGDPHYIRFNDELFTLSQFCRVVLLADNANYNGIYTITAIPSQDTSGKVSIDSILIMFGSKTYTVDETGLKVDESSVTLPFSDSNLNVNIDNGTIIVDASQFYLSFGDAFLKLVSCGSSTFGLCTSTEPIPSLNILKYSLTDLVKTLTVHTSWVYGLAPLNNDSIISGSFDKTVKITNINNGNVIKTFQGHTDFVFSVLLWGNGQVILSGSQDNTIKLWDVPNPNQLTEITTLTGHTGKIIALISLKNGSIVSGSADTTIKIWNINDANRNKNTLRGHQGEVRSLILLDNGNIVSSSDDTTIKIWSMNDGSVIRTLTGHGGSVRKLALLQNGNFASGSDDKTIKIWNINNQNPIATFTGHSDAVLTLVSLKNGNIASGSADNTVKIWDINTGKVLKTLTGHNGPIYSSILLPNGNIATGSYDSTIKIWSTIYTCGV